MENELVINKITAEDLLEKIRNELSRAKEIESDKENRSVALWCAVSDVIMYIEQYKTAKQIEAKLADKRWQESLIPYDQPGNCCPLPWEGDDETGMRGL